MNDQLAREYSYIEENYRADMELALELAEINERAEREVNRDLNSFRGKYALMAMGALSLSDYLKAADKSDIELLNERLENLNDQYISPLGRLAMEKLHRPSKKMSVQTVIIGLTSITTIDLAVKQEAVISNALSNAVMSEYRRQAINLDLNLDVTGITSKPKFTQRRLPNYITPVNKRPLRTPYVAKSVRQITQDSLNPARRAYGWSEDIWKYQNRLQTSLSREVYNGLVNGRHPTELAKTVRKEFEVTRSESERLMRTEMSRVQTVARHESYVAAGYDHYLYIAEGGACEICAGLSNGVPRLLVDEMIGVNSPPMHPNCKCSTAPTVVR